MSAVRRTLKEFGKEMYVPIELSNRVQAIGRRLDCELVIARCWQSEGGRPVLYANVRGTLHGSAELRIEIAGTVCAEMTPGIEDEVDLFLFVNGRRVGVQDQPLHHIIGYGVAPLVWDYNDEGFDQFLTLDDSTYSQPVDDALIIRPDNDRSSNHAN